MLYLVPEPTKKLEEWVSQVQRSLPIRDFRILRWSC